MFTLPPDEEAAVWAMLAREQDEIEAEALADGEVWWSDNRGTDPWAKWRAPGEVIHGQP